MESFLFEFLRAVVDMGELENVVNGIIFLQLIDNHVITNILQHLHFVLVSHDKNLRCLLQRKIRKAVCVEETDEQLENVLRNASDGHDRLFGLVTVLLGGEHTAEDWAAS